MPYIKLTQKFVDGQGQARAGRRKDNLMGRGQRACGGLRPTAHSGAKSFVFQYRTRKGSISRRMKLDGKYLPLETERKAKNGNGDKHERETGSPLDNAKAEAIAARNAVTAGRDQLTECCKKTTSATNTLQTIAEDYMKREGKKLKSRYERERILKKYIYPKLGPRQIDEIRRHDVVTHMDKIEDENGAVMADHVLAILRKVLNWHGARSDESKSPLVKGMNRAASTAAHVKGAHMA